MRKHSIKPQARLAYAYLGASHEPLTQQQVEELLESSRQAQKLLTEVQVADRLNVSPQTVATWRYRGCGPDLPWVKIGSNIRYREADVDALIAAGLRTSQQAA